VSIGELASNPSRKSLVKHFGRRSGLAQQRRYALAEREPFRANHDRRLPTKLRRPFIHACGKTASRAGMSRASLAKSLSARTSMSTGHFGVPIRRKSFSEVMLLIDDMARPCTLAGRDTSACRLVGRSLSPCDPFNQRGSACQGAIAAAAFPIMSGSRRWFYRHGAAAARFSNASGEGSLSAM
jgi:hypothetical protein